MEKTDKPEVLVTVEDLCKVFEVKQTLIEAIERKPRKFVNAVNHVNLEVMKGDIFGLVGESGCGKSTLARSIIHLDPPTSGRVVIAGDEISAMTRKEVRNHCHNFQMIFQDPYSSLNPRMTVREIITEELKYHKMYPDAEIPDEVDKLLEMVGLSKDVGHRYPGEFSGGQRQRIGIARALALKPQLIIADEPVSALDVSIQAQILKLLVDLQKKLDLTILFISHDLRVVEYITNRIAVMYLGEIVEQADTNELYRNPLHPYTKVLLNAAPVMDPDAVQNDEELIHGELPSPIDLPPGCHFAARCPNATDECLKVKPVLKEVKPGHLVACRLIQ